MSSASRIFGKRLDEVAACPRIRINRGAISIRREVARKTSGGPDDRIRGCFN